MNTRVADTMRLLELLGHDEPPFGAIYADTKPEGGFGPKPGEIFSREREAAGLIDWGRAFGNFSCVVGNILLARKRNTSAWISLAECGCMGGGFYTGMYSPYLETIPHYVSTGIPGTPIEGEHYLPSPEAMRAFLAEAAPPPGTGKYLVFKPISQFAKDEEPLVATFFARPEALTGLHSLACFASGDHRTVVSPLGAGCGGIFAWPLAYQMRGQERAVIGGFDPSARKFLKTDELTFSMPLSLYDKMLAVMEDSALTRETWKGVLTKVRKSRKTWGEV